MPKSVLTPRKSWTARFTVLALVASLMVAGAAPASAAIQDTSAACPASIPSAGFTDLGGIDATTVAAINCVVHYGISQGTSSTTFSHMGEVTRWQMALFLTRQAEDHGLTLPDGSPQGFTDIGSLDAATQKAINQLKQLGITSGTSATTFSPNDVVSRWQMALFLTRLLAGAGVVLGDGSPQGFGDIGTYDAATQKAINQLVQAGVTNGTSATTYTGDAAVLRWHMALFLTRVLAADGVTPTGFGHFVTLAETAYVDAADATVAGRYTHADEASCKLVVTKYKTSEKFSVNGVNSTLAAFEAALNSGGNKKISFSGGTHAITTAVVVSSGVVADVGPIEVREPVSDNVLATLATGALHEFYMIDGAAASLTAFNADVSVGDTITVTGGDGSSAAKAKTFSLTNGTASGTVASTVTSIDTGCQVLAVGDPVAGDSITIDGVAGKAVADYTAARSAGDAVTYSYKAGKGTWTLTNAGPSTVTAEAAAQKAGTAWVAYTSATASTAIDFATFDADPTTAGVQAFDSIKVNGVTATQADFLAALTPGDVITWRLADAPSKTKSALTLVDAAYTGIPAVWDTGANTLSVFSFGSTGNALDTVNYVTVDATLGLTLGTGGVVKHMVNGAAANEAQFEAAVALSAANKAGGVSVAKVGVDIVWSVSTS